MSSCTQLATFCHRHLWAKNLFMTEYVPDLVPGPIFHTYNLPELNNTEEESLELAAHIHARL